MMIESLARGVGVCIGPPRVDAASRRRKQAEVTPSYGFQPLPEAPSASAGAPLPSGGRSGPAMSTDGQGAGRGSGIGGCHLREGPVEESTSEVPGRRLIEHWIGLWRKEAS